ncbi:hypothetical protein BDW68DRAFT_43240 [Aspergillus falconensis]
MQKKSTLRSCQWPSTRIRPPAPPHTHTPGLKQHCHLPREVTAVHSVISPPLQWNDGKAREAGHWVQ